MVRPIENNPITDGTFLLFTKKYPFDFVYNMPVERLMNIFDHKQPTIRIHPKYLPQHTAKLMIFEVFMVLLQNHLPHDDVNAISNKILMEINSIENLYDMYEVLEKITNKNTYNVIYGRVDPDDVLRAVSCKILNEKPIPNTSLINSWVFCHKVLDCFAISVNNMPEVEKKVYKITDFLN